jgi:isopentenyl-diphosphate delta-isomerase
MSADEELEILDVVDADDLVVGAMERGEIHRKRLFHRSVHVFVLDEAGRVYLQQRSLAKQEHPGKWDSSASGHVASGESYAEAAARELEEELSLRALPEPFLKVPASEETGMEHSMLFQVRTRGTDPSPQPNPREILQGRFFPAKEIEAGIATEPETFSPSFRLLFRLYMDNTRREGG